MWSVRGLARRVGIRRPPTDFSAFDGNWDDLVAMVERSTTPERRATARRRLTAYIRHRQTVDSQPPRTRISKVMIDRERLAWPPLPASAPQPDEGFQYDE